MTACTSSKIDEESANELSSLAEGSCTPCSKLSHTNLQSFELSSKRMIFPEEGKDEEMAAAKPSLTEYSSQITSELSASPNFVKSEPAELTTSQAEFGD